MAVSFRLSAFGGCSLKSWRNPAVITRPNLSNTFSINPYPKNQIAMGRSAQPSAFGGCQAQISVASSGPRQSKVY